MVAAILFLARPTYPHPRELRQALGAGLGPNALDLCHALLDRGDVTSNSDRAPKDSHAKSSSRTSRRTNGPWERRDAP